MTLTYLEDEEQFEAVFGGLVWLAETDFACRKEN